MTRLNTSIMAIGYNVPSSEELVTSIAVNGNDQYILQFDDRYIFSNIDIDATEPYAFIGDMR